MRVHSLKTQMRAAIILLTDCKSEGYGFESHLGGSQVAQWQSVKDKKRIQNIQQRGQTIKSQVSLSLRSWFDSSRCSHIARWTSQFKSPGSLPGVSSGRSRPSLPKAVRALKIREHRILELAVQKLSIYSVNTDFVGFNYHRHQW